MEVVERYKKLAFLNITPVKGENTSYDWAIVGRGIEELEVTYNAQKKTTKYIIDKNATTRINGYQPSIDAEQIAYFGDECFDFVDDIRYNMKTGDEATTQILLVDKYKEVSEGNFRAQVFDCTISINSDGGPADDDSKVNYTIDINGDPINGTVAIANGVPTFTKTVSA